MGLVDHEVRPLDVKDGLVLGDGGQVLVAQYLIVHLGLKGNSTNGTLVPKAHLGSWPYKPDLPFIRKEMSIL